jgi:hypothetical protein
LLLDKLQKVLYPYCPIEEDGEKGSSRTFSQRKIAPQEVYKISLDDCVKR